MSENSKSEQYNKLLSEAAAKAGVTVEEAERELTEHSAAQVISTVMVLERLAADDPVSGHLMMRSMWKSFRSGGDDKIEGAVSKVILDHYFRYFGDWKKMVNAITDKTVQAGVDRDSLMNEAKRLFELKLVHAQTAARLARRIGLDKR